MRDKNKNNDNLYSKIKFKNQNKSKLFYYNVCMMFVF